MNTDSHGQESTPVWLLPLFPATFLVPTVLVTSENIVVCNSALLLLRPGAGLVLLGVMCSGCRDLFQFSSVTRGQAEGRSREACGIG